MQRKEMSRKRLISVMETDLNTFDLFVLKVKYLFTCSFLPGSITCMRSLGSVCLGINPFGCPEWGSAEPWSRACVGVPVPVCFPPLNKQKTKQSGMTVGVLRAVPEHTAPAVWLSCQLSPPCCCCEPKERVFTLLHRF